MLDELNIERKTGEERFTNCESLTLSDYWSWAHSDIVGNAERGILAEYIVSTALGVNNGIRTEWDRYDLLSKNDVKIEVKSSGYIQTWAQKKLSSPCFGIQPTQGWDPKTNKYSDKKKRQSDVYVFCVHKHEEQTTVNPLDMNQWEFYVLNTKVLDDKIPNQKTITIPSLKRLGAKHTLYENLEETINNVYKSIILVEDV